MATKTPRTPRKTGRSTRRSPRAHAKPRNRPTPPISANHTEVERVLPAQAVGVQALNTALEQAQFVTMAQFPDFYDGVLETLGVNPPEALYSHVVARLHTLACTTCSHFWYIESKDAAKRGWRWDRWREEGDGSRAATRRRGRTAVGGD